MPGFHLLQEPLDDLMQRLGGRSRLFPAAGGMVAFRGDVRNHHKGRSVLSLNYTAYPELALNEGRAIVSEAIREYRLVHAVAAHRYGHLEVGDTAVWVAAWAAHREEAFLGARYLIDQIKSRLPVWKEEFYTDGSSTYIHASQ